MKAVRNNSVAFGLMSMTNKQLEMTMSKLVQG
jgi:hypothetical protein